MLSLTTSESGQEIQHKHKKNYKCPTILPKKFVIISKQTKWLFNGVMHFIKVLCFDKVCLNIVLIAGSCEGFSIWRLLVVGRAKLSDDTASEELGNSYFQG